MQTEPRSSGGRAPRTTAEVAAFARSVGIESAEAEESRLYFTDQKLKGFKGQVTTDLRSAICKIGVEKTIYEAAGVWDGRCPLDRESVLSLLSGVDRR